jgi:hypothetical protein
VGSSSHREPSSPDPNIVAAAVEAARLQGCDCQPDIITKRRGQILGIAGTHDHWCALLADPPPDLVVVTDAGSRS